MVLLTFLIDVFCNKIKKRTSETSFRSTHWILNKAVITGSSKGLQKYLKADTVEAVPDDKDIMIKDNAYDVMALTVHLPNGSIVDTSVNKKTPMMDVLVQIATTYHFQPSAHYMCAFSSKSSHEKAQKSILFTPNTPIGSLPVQFIQILPKSQLSGHRVSTKSLYSNQATTQLVENTYRLKIFLPRNQFYVLRVTPLTKVCEVFQKVCSSKSLDSSKYELQLLSNNNQVLEQDLTLLDYGQVNEICLVIKQDQELSAASFSTREIMSMKKSSIAVNQTKAPPKSIKGQLLSSIFNKNKPNISINENQSVLSSLSSSSTADSRSDDCPLSTLSSQQSSEDFRSSSENVHNQETPSMKSACFKKRRQAPKPPPPPISTIEVPHTEPLKGHSRNSSDSSGYHENSLSSDNYNTLPPPVMNEIQKSLLNMKIHSKSMSNLQSTLLSRQPKKKKPPPPPPASLKQCHKDEKTLVSIEENNVADKERKPEEFFGPKYLSLENLEKRRSLVLQRELTNLNNEILKEHSRLQNKPAKSEDKYEQDLKTASTLPNFSISTYNNDNQPKNLISIYEDDSIRSNVNIKRHSSVHSLASGHQHFSYKKTEEDDLDVNNRFPLLNIRNDKVIKRSVSNAGLITNGYNRNCNSSDDCWNVSDLQSLNVMRKILPQLNKEESGSKIDIRSWTDRSKSLDYRQLNNTCDRTKLTERRNEPLNGNNSTNTETVTVRIVDLKVKKLPNFKYDFKSVSNAEIDRTDLLSSIRNFGGTAGFCRK